MTEGICVVTGGAGFIGCALSAGLTSRFGQVIALDILHPQIHAKPVRPAALHSTVDFRRCDITEPGVWDSLLSEIAPDLIIHLAAETGTGQSLTEASRHAHLSMVYGATVMLDALSASCPDPKPNSSNFEPRGVWRRRLAAATARSSTPASAGASSLRTRRGTSPTRPRCRSRRRGLSRARPTSTERPSSRRSTSSRRWAAAFGSALTLARLQNVYGPGQSLINSYTGIVSLFARLAREGKSIPVYEDRADAARLRAYVDDVAGALLAAVDGGGAGARRGSISAAARPRRSARSPQFIARRYGAPSAASERRLPARRCAARLVRSFGDASARSPGPRAGRSKTGLEALCQWIDARPSSVRPQRRAP